MKSATVLCMPYRRRHRPTIIGALAGCLLLAVAIILIGCKKDEMYDNAMINGAKAGVKAIGAKANGQKRVNDATAILDGK